MVANFKDRIEVERFLRDANAEELHAQRQQLITSTAAGAPEHMVWNLVARIAYELRFRVPQSI